METSCSSLIIIEMMEKIREREREREREIMFVHRCNKRSDKNLKKTSKNVKNAEKI